MSIAAARSSHALIGATLVAAAAALFSGCGDQSTERKGGDDLPDLTAGSPASVAGASVGGAAVMADGGASGASEAGAAGAMMTSPVQWCDAYKVINCVCQQCHQNPPLNGAPIPLLTYEDTQAPFPFATSTKLVWNKMQTDVTGRIMPYMGDPNIKPTVQPLTDEQFDTLTTWLDEGAHDEGGTACTATCDWSDGTPEL